VSSAFQFTHVIARQPGRSVVDGLRDGAGADPDYALFLHQHELYLDALRHCGVTVTLLEPLEDFPDSVFVEDAALCLADTAILTRPGAASRFAEAATLKSALASHFRSVLELPGTGHLDGGDVLLTQRDVFVGLSERTDQAGVDALKAVVGGCGYELRQVRTPSDILHFKSACGLLDDTTVFSTQALADTGCFANYDVIIAPPGEGAAANLIRVNDYVLISAGFARTRIELEARGYRVLEIDTSEAAKIDAGLSCMSLRYALSATS